MEKPTKNSTKQEVYEYALELYKGDTHKAASYVKGWFRQPSKN